MIRFGLRLALATGGEALLRLLTVTVAVALGSALLLAALAGINGVDRQNQRYAWLNSHAARGGTAAGVDSLLWRLRADYYDGQQLVRVDVAATGPHSPVPPGIGRVPADGEFYASASRYAPIMPSMAPAPDTGDAQWAASPTRVTRPDDQDGMWSSCGIPAGL